MNFEDRLSEILMLEEGIREKKTLLLNEVSAKYLASKIAIARINDFVEIPYGSVYAVIKNKEYFNSDVVSAAIRVLAAKEDAHKDKAEGQKKRVDKKQPVAA